MNAGNDHMRAVARKVKMLVMRIRSWARVVPASFCARASAFVESNMPAVIHRGGSNDQEGQRIQTLHTQPGLIPLACSPRFAVACAVHVCMME
jgi:hypothetical protein